MTEVEMERLAQLRGEVIASLTVEQKQKLIFWLEAESAALEWGMYKVPSYSDSEAAASHGVSMISAYLGG